MIRAPVCHNWVLIGFFTGSTVFWKGFRVLGHEGYFENEGCRVFGFGDEVVGELRQRLFSSVLSCRRL